MSLFYLQLKYGFCVDVLNVQCRYFEDGSGYVVRAASFQLKIFNIILTFVSFLTLTLYFTQSDGDEY